MKKNNESGNILWMILLTIALLAALTVAITKLSDSTEQGGDIERYRIHASAIMRHSAGIKEGVERLRMTGIGESQMSFEVSYLSSGLYTNANCTGRGCLIYSSSGGGMSYEAPNTAWLDASHSTDDQYGAWEFSGGNSITGVGTSRPELMMFLGYLQPDLCAQINAMLGISGGVPVDGDGFDVSGYAGSYSSSATIDNMDGLESGCFRDTSGGGRDYTYYQVLIKR